MKIIVRCYYCGREISEGEGLPVPEKDALECGFCRKPDMSLGTDYRQEHLAGPAVPESRLSPNGEDLVKKYRKMNKAKKEKKTVSNPDSSA